MAESCRAAGELVAQLYDIRGCPCAQEFSSRFVGLTLAELKQIPLVIGLAATAGKAMAIYGALRGRYLQALITDESAARGVLALFEQDFQRKQQNPPTCAA
jgi:DNA-binding transcriptional regulator LsrR (DeoR family)